MMPYLSVKTILSSKLTSFRTMTLRDHEARSAPCPVSLLPEPVPADQKARLKPQLSITKENECITSTITPAWPKIMPS